MTMPKKLFSKENQPPAEKKKRGRSERTKILEAMENKGRSEGEFYELLVERAFNPDDSFGAPELLRRIAPLAKATLPKVEFDFDPKADPVTQANQIVSAVSKGILTADVGKIVIDCITATLSIEEHAELKERLIQVEESLGI